MEEKIRLNYLIERVKQLLLEPKKTWDLIQKEETSTKSLLFSYMLPLVLIPTIASFIGYGFVGGSYFRVSSVNWGINQAVMTFLGAVLGVFISAWCIHKLANSFKTQVSINNALKLVIYSYTAVWVAGVLHLVPALSILGLLAGIYSLYLLYLGFVPITKVAEENKTSYFVVSILVIIGVSMVLSFALGAILVAIGLSY